MMYQNGQVVMEHFQVHISPAKHICHTNCHINISWYTYLLQNTSPSKCISCHTHLSYKIPHISGHMYLLSHSSVIQNFQVHISWYTYLYTSPGTNISCLTHLLSHIHLGIPISNYIMHHHYYYNKYLFLTSIIYS